MEIAAEGGRGKVWDEGFPIDGSESDRRDARPHGTKSLVQAFFSAAGDIPEARRDAVIHAALAAIGDRLTGNVAKAKATKTARKAKITAPKASAKLAPKSSVRRPAKTAAAPKASTKSKVKSSRKATAKRVPGPTAAESAE